MIVYACEQQCAQIDTCTCTFFHYCQWIVHVYITVLSSCKRGQIRPQIRNEDKWTDHFFYRDLVFISSLQRHTTAKSTVGPSVRCLLHLTQVAIVNKKSQILCSIQIYSYSEMPIEKESYICKTRDKCQSNTVVKYTLSRMCDPTEMNF